MTTRSARLGAQAVPAVLLVAAAAASGTLLLAPRTVHAIEGLASAITAGACLLAGVAILASAGRPNAWRTARWPGFGALGFGAINLVIVYQDLADARIRAGAYDALFLVVSVVFLVPAVMEFRDHLPKGDRREIVTDVALVSVACGSALFVLLQAPDMDGPTTASLALSSLIVTTAIAAYAALALWVPTPAHVGLLVSVIGLFLGVLTFSVVTAEGTYRPAQTAVNLPILLGALLLAFVTTIVPRQPKSSQPSPRTRYGRPVLTTLSVTAACAALALLAGQGFERRLDRTQGLVLIGLLAAAIAVRILVNQLRGTNATRAAQDALDQKEVALRETDRALARLQRANETLRESEERLRTVFDSAVDGIVELDERDVIVHANESFCGMIQLPQSLIEGQPWTALAASIEADESFAGLPATGQGSLRRDGHPVYLESRMSQIPGDHPRRLLLVRDVTAARVADQTIRSLFKFLQDRDEDRTRIMRRTNAAIESERNRIARDLHDGPVQGVSAASLSLEAVLLMLKVGDVAEGLEVLGKVRRELSEEADNLRRLMSGLRPPLLEERGLIPALRETLDKYGQDNGVDTEFIGRATIEIPQDLETLAYRIVQEALSNSSKHAGATRVTATVEAAAEQLRIEIADDGSGFDAGQAREFLRQGRVGLASMRERVELANGTFMVHSTPGRGTTVLATLPLEGVPALRELAVHEA
jgi:PAS domain S-box-containing protein